MSAGDSDPRETSQRSTSETPGSDRQRLNAQILSGARWVAIARVMSEVVNLGGMIVLARLVSPTQYGEAAIALVIITLATVLGTGGVGAALVQRNDVTQAHRESGQALGMLIGGGFTVAVFLTAPLLEGPFTAQTAELAKLASPAFFLASLPIVSLSSLERRLDFRRISRIEMSATMSGTILAVGLAVVGLNGAAVVLGILGRMVVSAGLTLRAGQPARPRLHRRQARELLSFGAPMTAATLINSGVKNVDYVIIGSRLSVTDLGFYFRAFQLGVEYQRKATVVLQRVALAMYSRAVDDDHLRALRRRVVELHTVVIFPFLGAFVAVAPELIPFAFGRRWEPMIVPAQILAVGGAALAVMAGTGPLMYAIGKPRAMLYFQGGWLLAYTGIIYAAAGFGLEAACVGASAALVGTAIAMHGLLLRPSIGIPMRALWSDTAPALAGTAVLVVTMLGLKIGVATFAGDVLAAALALPAGAAAYILTLRLGFPALWAKMSLIIGRVVLPARRHGVVTPSLSGDRVGSIEDR